MRKILIRSVVMSIMFLSLAAGAFSSARAQDATPAADCPVTTPEQNVEIAKRWFTDLPAGLDDLTTDDFTIESGMGADLTSREETLARLAAISAAVPNSTHEYDVVVSTDDMVVLRWKGTGTFSAPYLGVAPTGEEVTLSGIHIFQIKCGQISQIWAETNLYEMHLQLLGGAAATPTP